MPEQENPREVRLNVRLPEQQAAGVWSNFARVHHSEHEFTIDFVRLDYGSLSDEGEMQGIVVARVGLSPQFVTQLVDALEDNWKKWSRKAMPKEVHEDESDA